MYLNSVNAAANRMIQNCCTVIHLYMSSLLAINKVNCLLYALCSVTKSSQVLCTGIALPTISLIKLRKG